MSSIVRTIQLRVPRGSWNGYLAHGGSLYFVMNESCGALSSAVLLCVNMYAHFHIATAAQEVVKNLVTTNPAETSVVMSETRRWRVPSEYRGVVVSIAL